MSKQPENAGLTARRVIRFVVETAGFLSLATGLWMHDRALALIVIGGLILAIGILDRCLSSRAD